MVAGPDVARGGTSQMPGWVRGGASVTPCCMVLASRAARRIAAQLGCASMTMSGSAGLDVCGTSSRMAVTSRAMGGQGLPDTLS